MALKTMTKQRGPARRSRPKEKKKRKDNKKREDTHVQPNCILERNDQDQKED